ncbi:MAG: 3-phosphoserine/phosphohydroxythreonine transaminase [Desulfamplus sp.]|nr:3-phosphoserine/phosphohydroxythreonine transaminase [Desulfamplus sp.]
MTENRIFNFNAGPSALPLTVLKEIQASFLNFKGSGMSITEISHRSGAFDDVINDTVARTRRLFNIDEKYHVLFVQGGASLQFAMIPMNFLGKDATADYVNTGTWSTKAIKEAKLLEKKINVVASSEDKNFSYIPQNLEFNKDAKYVHITSNNTIKGTQWHKFPDTNGVPIVSDMSSDIFSRPLEMDKFGMIYAGAQKNMGPAGVCMVILRDDMLKLSEDLLQSETKTLPNMLRYNTYSSQNSMYNTPNCFAIYTIQLVLKWIEEEIGGLAKMESHNQEKGKMLYDFIDNSNFYRATAEQGSRSLMNVTFRLPSEELEKEFISQATKNGLGGLKGHRSVGGCRASTYNATTMEGIAALINFMKSFATGK